MPPRFFVRAPYTNTVEELLDWAHEHGRPLQVRCYEAHDGVSIAGSAEVDPSHPVVAGGHEE